MGDITTVSTRPKEGPSSIKCPMLTATNYTVWAMHMKVLLKVHKVWETVESETIEPEENDMATTLLF